MSAHSKPNSGYDWYIVGILFTISVLGYIDRVVLSFLVEPIKAELDLSDAQLGAVTGLAFALLYVLGGVFLGRLLDKGRRVFILTICILVWSIATGATGFVTGFALLFIARMFVGVGEAGLNPAAIGIISNRFDAENVQKPIGLFTMGLFVGGGLAMLLGGQLLQFFEAQGPYELPLLGETQSWRLVFITLAFPGILLAIILLLTVRDRNTIGTPTGASEHPAEAAALISGAAYAQRNKLLLILLSVSVVFWSMNNYGLLNWYPAMLMRTYDMSPMLVANTYGPAFLVGGIAGCIAVTPALNWLRKRYQDRAVALLCAISMAVLSVTTFLGPLVPTTTLAIVLAFINLFVSAMSVTSVYVLLVAVVPLHLRGLYTGLYLALVNLTGAAFGSVLVGLISDNIFGPERLNYSISLMALLFGPIAAYLMLRASRIQVRSN
ncbi:MAG: MFS transporter [Henriciella sp.]|nr:MFS transporter [Henriciella sp.]